MNRDFLTNGIAPRAMLLKTIVMCSCALAAIALGAPAAGAMKPRAENAPVVAPSGPLVAVVSLGAQRLSVYDKNGQVLTSRVSSGRAGYETPQGVFAIIERNREHFSNLYDDAPMPNMQRITWSGVAMHAGGLPGYPASHGCIRLPLDVSDRLFELTKLGTRVVVTDGIAVPVAFEHARLFNVRSAEPGGSVGGSVAPMVKSLPGAMSLPMMLGAVVATPVQASVPASLPPAAPDVFADRPADVSRAAWATELLGRAQKADAFARSAKASAATAQKQADRAMQQVLASERARSAHAAKVDALEAALQRSSNAKVVARIELARTAAVARLAQTLAETDRLRAIQEQTRNDANRMAAVAGQAANAKAASGALAREAGRRLKPVSVFVSRATGRLYARQGFEPLFDIEITIDNPAAPIGTHVFTALETNVAEKSVHWSAVTAVGNPPSEVPVPRKSRAKNQPVEASTPTLTAAAALDRVGIPEVVRQRIGEMLIPGSSLIVSDHEISSETGKGTDFVILTR